MTSTAFWRAAAERAAEIAALAGRLWTGLPGLRPPDL